MYDSELLAPLLPLAEGQEYSLSPQHPTSAAYAGIICGKQALQQLSEITSSELTDSLGLVKQWQQKGGRVKIIS